MAGRRNTHRSGPVRFEPDWKTRTQPVQRPFLPPVPVRHVTTVQLPVQRPVSPSRPAVRPEPAPRAIVPYVPPPPSTPRSSRRRRQGVGWPTLSLGLLAVTAVLLLATLNCALFVLRSQSRPKADDVVVMVRQLPTLTPTAETVAVARPAVPAQAASSPEVGPAAVAPSPTPTFIASPTPVQNQPAAPAVPTPTPTPTIALPPTATPTPVPTVVVPVANAGGWSFAGTSATFAPRRNMALLFGEMVNDTGTAQKVSLVTGTFYDELGQVIVENKDAYPTWPVNVVPPGGRLPFALTVYDIKSAARFELSVKSEPVEVAPRQNFEFLAVNQKVENNKYCLSGGLKNLGSALEQQLIIAAVLYDDQGNVLRFVDETEPGYKQVVGDRTMDFELCLKSPPANVARHELLAWGI